MAIDIDAYIGRGNSRRIQLLEGGALVDPNIVTRVVIHFDGTCLDTDEPTDPISLINDETEIELKLGLCAFAAPGTITGNMTVFTTTGPTEGLAWPENERIAVTFHEWSACA